MPISDYLRGLRAKVGTDLLLVPAVTMVCRDEDGRVLLARHADNDRWALPGGSIDPDETPADAAVRELWEEAGLRTTPERIIGVYGGPAFTVTYPNGDQIASVDTVFACRIDGGTLAADQDEITELRYVSEAEATQLNLPPWAQLVLADVFRNTNQTHFQPPTWTPPADGVRKGGISDYVRDLRQHIGTDLLLMPSVGTLVYDDLGNILLQQRSDSGLWSAPVGGMDPGETPADAVVREVWEETGVLVEPVQVMGVYGGPKFRNTHPNGDQTASIFMIFACRVVDDRGLSPDGHESLDVRYFPQEEALAMLSRLWQRRMGFLPELNRSAAQFEAATWRA
ncbi:MAG: NUDIX domain-containing protein [Caldilineaceae bacterium]|nr:NUDIX domain-containing protein [Caldilineaceae bacterium]